MDNNFQSILGHKLIRYGMLLFLLGLLTGFLIPLMRNPRMGLASHLEAVMNGMFLILLGLIWQILHLSVGALQWGYALALFGTFTNWFTNLLAAICGAGAEMLPIAGGGYQRVAGCSIGFTCVIPASCRSPVLFSQRKSAENQLFSSEIRPGRLRR